MAIVTSAEQVLPSQNKVFGLLVDLSDCKIVGSDEYIIYVYWYTGYHTLGPLV